MSDERSTAPSPLALARRLRGEAEGFEGYSCGSRGVDWRTCPDCKQDWPHPSVMSGLLCPACRNSALSARLAAAEVRCAGMAAALAPFAELAPVYAGKPDDGYANAVGGDYGDGYYEAGVTVGNLRRAARALADDGNALALVLAAAGAWADSEQSSCGLDSADPAARRLLDAVRLWRGGR